MDSAAPWSLTLCGAIHLTNEWLRFEQSFLQKMVMEHTKMPESMQPFAESWGLTPPAGLDDDDHQKEYDKLSGLSGADFDKEYMSQMVRDHTQNMAYDLEKEL
jgi:predicted outer membrane protein